MHISDWYLLLNGSDVLDCGRNLSAACQSFSWLLDRIREVSSRSEASVSILTDVDLIIDRALLVCKISFYL